MIDLLIRTDVIGNTCTQFNENLHELVEIMLKYLKPTNKLIITFNLALGLFSTLINRKICFRSKSNKNASVEGEGKLIISDCIEKGIENLLIEKKKSIDNAQDQISLNIDDILKLINIELKRVN